SDPQIFRTFFRPSGDLTILGAGEGEFVNHVNPFDVNLDKLVSPADALTVINDLNAEGPRTLMSGVAPTLAMPAMIDVNMDGTLSPGDALAVVNFLNAKSSFFASHAAGGEGESDVGGALNGAS